ncbi:hypothetical protein, conserved [Leishmania tarentolae]|uniref:Uncharacterized protein n=1 Tax=Leishmania tarentolae TaxID=5689 RepID=A0A640KM97_LEITA|nr:hypothetical protein, conserved [Leishmania tarentolae]
MRGSKAPLSFLCYSLQRTAKLPPRAPPLPSVRALCVSSLSADYGSLSTIRRWQSTTPSSEDAPHLETPSASSEAGEEHSKSGVPVMERAADARRAIYELWSRTAVAEERAQSSLDSMSTNEEAAAETKAVEERCEAVAALLEKYKLDPSTPREENISRGLGDALDRLLLLCVPLSSRHGTDLLVKLMQVSAQHGRQFSMRTIQHLFARTSSYAEALAVFYAMRRSNFAMSMEAYHAMLYSLQRLEEEGWAARFHEEFVSSKGEAISEQALDFILRGVDNQLMPENKPWLGRIMFAEVKDNKATQRQSMASFDEMGKLWVQRYKNGGAASE